MHGSRDDATGLGLLADPARRRLYDAVVGRDAPVTREDAAAAAGISRGLAAYHLDKLAAAGLLDVAYGHEPGRGGPGSGRPAKRYTRSARELSVSLPPRNYGFLARILAEVAEAAGAGREGPVRAAVVGAAEGAGRTLAADEGELSSALVAGGYEPAAAEPGGVVLRNCPFHSIVQDHTELVCTLNHAVIRGVLAGVGADPGRAALRPGPGRCCVVIDPAAPPDRPPPPGAGSG